MPAITFQVDDHGVPPGVFLFVGRKWYGLACRIFPEIPSTPYAVTLWKQDDPAVIDFDERVRKAINSKVTILATVGDVKLSGELAEQYVAFELARAVLHREMQTITRHARYEAASKYICGIEEMIESLEHQMTQVNCHGSEGDGLTQEQFERLKSAHSAIETAYTDLDQVIDPEID